MAHPLMTAPVDPLAVSAYAARGLEPRVVTPDDPGFESWLQIVARGFLDGEPSEEQISASRERSAFRRMTGVYDATAPMPDAPVASIASWVTELSVPGGRSIPACAISAVTVSPTHRRRGIARAMLEGELRLAASQGVPMAVLTVSESTLYGRYGFAPAAAAAELRLDVKRATWTGPAPEGRVDFIPRERLRELIPALHDSVRLSSPGEIVVPDGHWDAFAGTRPDAKEPGNHRAIQYTDIDGAVRGLALYSVRANHDDFTKATVTVEFLLAQTPDAYAALWRFFVELDLVAEVRAGELSTAEPLLWMIDDQRAATVTVTDHQYLRVVDVPAALEARTFGAPGRIALTVTDPLGIAGGDWLLVVDEAGRATVTQDASGVEAAEAVAVRLGIAELSAAYLGGVSLATLAAAGRVQTTDADAAARIFSWHVVPRLSFWY